MGASSIYFNRINHFEEYTAVTLYFRGDVEIVFNEVFVGRVWHFVFADGLDDPALHNVVVVDFEHRRAFFDLGVLVRKRNEVRVEFIASFVYVYFEALVLLRLW